MDPGRARHAPDGIDAPANNHGVGAERVEDLEYFFKPSPACDRIIVHERNNQPPPPLREISGVRYARRF